MQHFILQSENGCDCKLCLNGLIRVRPSLVGDRKKAAVVKTEKQLSENEKGNS